MAVPYTDENGTLHNSVVLDLGGQTLTGAADQAAIIVEEGGSLTLKGDGVITSAYGKAVIDVLPGAELIVESANIEATGADSAHAIKVQGTATINGGTINATKGNGIFVSNEGAKLVINGGTIKGGNAAVIGNGNQKGTIIEINGGTIINEANTAIYHPQDGELIINDGEISGVVGVEIRAGKLNVSGGKISGIGEFGIEPNGNGSTVTGGCAVAVSQHSTNKDINVNISDGTFTGEYALYEADVQKEPSDNIFMSITGGTFNGAIYSENVKGFISGGTFDTDVAEYMA